MSLQCNTGAHWSWSSLFSLCLSEEVCWFRIPRLQFFGCVASPLLRRLSRKLGVRCVLTQRVGTLTAIEEGCKFLDCFQGDTRQ